jgi:microcystin-dependent protein
MSEPFLAEIRMFGFDYSPKGWAFCDGQLLPISQHTALFSIFGITYGGDGRTTFALPDLQGRVPMHPGQGPGLSPRQIGERGGTGSVVLKIEELPAHSHSVSASRGDALEPSPAGQQFAAGRGVNYYGAPGQSRLHGSALAASGGGQPHNNMQPYLTLKFNIALRGIFPPRG